jgi:hypothetical protein
MDWQFWQLTVTAAAALLGFLGGTLIKYWLDRRPATADGSAMRPARLPQPCMLKLPR